MIVHSTLFDMQFLGIFLRFIYPILASGIAYTDPGAAT